MRRLTFEPEPELGPGLVAPGLATAVEHVLDESKPSDELAGLLEHATGLARAGGVAIVGFEAEPAPDALDRQCRSAGFDLVRTMLQLRRTLPLPDELHRTPALRLRPFRPGADEQAWLRVNHRAFEWHPEQGDWTLDDLLVRESEPWFRPDGFLLLDDTSGDRADDQADDQADDRGLDGFCWAKIHADEHPPLGEIYVIGVDPVRHGHGLGRALVVAGLDWLSGQGIEQAMLYVEADNAPALHLYRELGFVEHTAHRWWRRDH